MSTAPSWAKVVTEYRAMLEPCLSAPGLHTWVQEAVGGAESRDQKIQRLLSRLQQQVRYVGLEFGEAAIMPRRPEETLRRGYGDCKDQSVLLASLLREAGIEAHVALLRAGESRDFTPEFPGLSAFNHAIVHVPGRFPLWIDPTVPQARVGQIPPPDAGRNVLIIAPDTKGITRVPAFAAQENCEAQTREIFLASDGPGRVVETTTTRGVAEVSQRIQFTGAEPERVKAGLKDYVKNNYRAEVVGDFSFTPPLDLEQPFRMRLEALKVGYAFTSTKDARAVLNPWPLVSALNEYLKPGELDPREKMATGEKTADSRPRRTHLQLARPWSGEFTWTIHPPDGYTLEALPANRICPFGPAKLQMAWRWGRDGDVEAVFRFDCDQLRWTPKEVDEARAALKAFGEEPIPVVVFQNRGEAHLEAGRLREAMAEFRRLSARHPELPAPLVRLAQAQYAAGLMEASRNTLIKAITLDPTAENPHRQLGWNLEHDDLGRRFKGNWDRGGAVAELRKSMELAPDLRMARLDLAILLGHDQAGDWWASQDIDAAIQLYRDQLARGADARAQEQLTTALARTGKFAEARASTQRLEEAKERLSWTVALDACLGEVSAAIQEARRSIQDPEVRRKAFQDASDLLMDLRRYSEAGLIAQECGTGSDGAKYRSRAELAAKLQFNERFPEETRTPFGAVQALARATSRPDFDPDKTLLLLSPPQRPMGKDRATLLTALDGFHYLRTGGMDWRRQKLDQFFSDPKFAIEGTDETGYCIKAPRPNIIPSPVFVSRKDGGFRVVSWGTQPSRLGKEALWEADHGHLEAARAWLDRAMDQVVQPTVQDPLIGHPVGFVWAQGRKGGLEEIRLAASVLIILGESHEAAWKIVESAADKATEPNLRSALLRALALNPPPGSSVADPLTAKLLALCPGNPRAVNLRSYILRRAGRFEEALAIVRASRKERPNDLTLAQEESRLLSWSGHWDEANQVLEQAIKAGGESASVLNTLAWNDVCRGRVTRQSAEWAERAVQLAKNAYNNHTLACVYAELGRYSEARAALLESVPAEGPITHPTWLAMGLIAQSLGDLDSARVYYARVDVPENPEEPTPESTKVLVRKRLASMK
ncbi:transglutaminase domain-containing protein [Geothrix terrae]|uniref:transglutaminase domain-containing protein n=1 Tax=Geothrix terrae TaxID=2922720 RepID=UPI001FAC6ADA|nr:transglutaminase domain-containing protein [Geothrix terrae]